MSLLCPSPALRSVAYSHKGGPVERRNVCLRPLPWSGHRLLFFLWPDTAQTQAETGMECDKSREDRRLYEMQLLYDLPVSFPPSLKVSDLGCQAFAVLFDDIDHSLCQADSEAFSSFAHAQVTITNEIYRFLGEPPVFLFCPTGRSDARELKLKVCTETCQSDPTSVSLSLQSTAVLCVLPVSQSLPTCRLWERTCCRT